MRDAVVAVVLALAALQSAVAPAAAQAAPDLGQVPWSHGAMCQDPATTDGLPQGECRHMRVLLKVAVPDALRGMSNLPVTTTLDVADALRSLGDYPHFSNGQLAGFELDLDSLVLVEVQAGTWVPVHLDAGQHAVPEALLAFPGDLGSAQPFDAKSNPTVTLQWVMAGTTTATRYFMLYLDSLHEGHKTPVQSAPAQLAQVASAVGPGRGNTAYVALHGDLGIATSSDPRVLRVTNLQPTAVGVDVYLYERFNTPRATPDLHADLPAGVGQTVAIQLPASYDGEAAKVVATGGLVEVEATSRVGSSTFQAGSSRLFLPSVDGGYVGTRFAGQSPVAMDWLVFCPNVAENTQDCAYQGSLGAGSIVLGTNYATLHAAAGQAVDLQATTGRLAVERVPPAGSAGRDQMGLTLWPAADGPVTSSLFVGDASSAQGLQDKLALIPTTSGSRLNVYSMEARATLADDLNPRGPGVFTDGTSGAWGTSWKRDWVNDATGQHPQLQDGGVRIRDTQGRGLSILDGVDGDDNTFSAYVPPQTPDGGLTYTLTIPADSQGRALGHVAVFAPFPGSNATAHRIAGSGVAGDVSLDALQADEYVPSLIDKAGTWVVHGRHPLALAWVKVGSEPMAAFAPAMTLGLTASPVAAQFAGYAFEAEANLFQSARPGSSASFVVTLHNRSRRTDGHPLQDAALISATVPTGWQPAAIVPTTVVLPPGESRDTNLTAQVPSDVDLAQGGATVEFRATSNGEPGFRVDLPLRINYKVERGVEVTADGRAGTDEQDITASEVATFVVRVTNTGTVPDAFHLEYALPADPWSITVECPSDPCFEGGELTTPTLPVNGHLEFHVQARSSSAAAARLTTPFLATSLADPSISGVVRLLTVLDAERKLSVVIEETSRIVLPGDAGNFTITFRNDGEQDEEVRLGLNATGPAGWSQPGALLLDPELDGPVDLHALNNTFGVRTHQQVVVKLIQAVPPDAAPGGIMVMRLTVDSGHAEAAASQTARDHSEHQLRVISGRSSGLNVTGLPAALDVLPGASADAPLTIHSSSNADQVVRVQASVQPFPGDWNVTLDGRAGPWTVNVTAHGSLALALKVTAAGRAAATALHPATLLLTLGVPGAAVVPAKVELRVPDARDLTLAESSLRLESGHAQQVTLHLRNRGNVPLTVGGQFTDLEWAARWENTTVPPGQDSLLRVWLDVPVTGASRTATLRLLDRATGAVLASRALALDVRAPQLEVQVTGTRALANGLRSYTLALTNHAASPARNVQVQLLQGERVLDAGVLESILPGASGTLHLVSAEQEGLALRIRSADEPQGRTIALEGVPGLDGGFGAAKPSPAPAAALTLLVLLTLAAAVAARRRA